MLRSGLAMMVMLLALTACSQTPNKSPFTGFYRGFDTCRAEVEAADARIAAAHVGNAEYFRPPGFPYLRTDRLLASMRNQLGDQDAVWEWTRRMRELDREIREYELASLDMDDYERAVLRDRLGDCGRVLSDVELKDPRNWERLLRTVEPVDEYSTLARAISFYPLVVPAKQARLKADRAAWNAAYVAALPPLEGGVQARTWSAQAPEELRDGATPMPLAPNELGYPGLVGSGWRVLAQTYAPRLWIEARDDHDVPARLRYREAKLEADPSTPTVYYHFGYTRFGGQILIQVSYYVWFAAPAQAPTVPVDGFVWRVTFDPSLRPLVYDSAHGSGRDHRWYPVQALALQRGGRGGEPQFIAPLPAPDAQAALRLASGSHAIRRVVAGAEAVSAAGGEYELRPYEDLYRLPTVAGHTRSAFAPDGKVRDSRGADPAGGFTSGILDAGALRQIGHLPIAHVGKRHWDDEDLLASVFVAPAWPAPPKPAAVAADAAR